MKITEKYGSCCERVWTCLTSPVVSSCQWSALIIIIMIMWVCTGVPFITFLLVRACAACLQELDAASLKSLQIRS